MERAEFEIKSCGLNQPFRPLAGSDYTISAWFCQDSFVADKFASHTRFWKIGDETKSCNVTCLGSAIFFVCVVRKPHDESLACQKFWGIAWRFHCRLGGNPANSWSGQCLLTSKELTSKVKTSRDAWLTVIPADTVDNPRVGWIAWKKSSTLRNCGRVAVKINK